MTDFQHQVIEEFRANNGLVGGMFAGSTLVLLTTVGARSGLPRTSPLGYLDIDGQPVVVASAMGAPTHPAWYHNIRRSPAVTVEVGAETYQAMAGIPGGAERDQLFERVVELAPGYGEYQAKTTRVIPVVTLHRVTSGGLGDFLVEGHDWLRKELAELRREADRPELVRQLREHCATFCGALTRHHGGEQMGAFPMLAGRFPALAPVLATLAEDHVVVERLQEEIQRLAGDPERLRGELDRLAGLLEDHFAYEEKTIIDALNSLGRPDFG